MHEVFFVILFECNFLMEFHLLGAFEDPDIIHVDDLVDPVRDLETISAELRLKVGLVPLLLSRFIYFGSRYLNCYPLSYQLVKYVEA